MKKKHSAIVALMVENAGGGDLDGAHVFLTNLLSGKESFGKIKGREALIQT